MNLKKKKMEKEKCEHIIIKLDKKFEKLDAKIKGNFKQKCIFFFPIS